MEKQRLPVDTVPSREAAEALLNRCRAAETVEEQKESFEELALWLERETESSVANPESSSDRGSGGHKQRERPGEESFVGLLAARETVARSVLTTWPYYGPASISARSCLDRVLDACSLVVVVSTCSGLLKEVASKAPGSAGRHRRPEESGEPGTLPSWPLPPRSIVEACWATLRRLLLAAPPYPSLPQKVSLPECQRFVSAVVLLLPQALANACHAVGLGIPLHAAPARFYPRLVRCAWSNAKRLEATAALPCAGSGSFWETYANVLAAQMLRTRRSEDLAKALVQQLADAVAGGDDDDALCPLLPGLRGLEPGETAALVLALLRCSGLPPRHSTAGKGKADAHRRLAKRTQRVCGVLFWSSSMEHQEAILERLVFSHRASVPVVRHGGERNGRGDVLSRQPLSARGDPRRWSRQVAGVLAPPAASGSDSGSNPWAVFSGHLASIAERWSQWTFVQEAEAKLQHHVSLVLWRGLVRLESSLSPLQGSLQEPSHRQLTAALVNGVSHRLASTLTVPRQDGMRIAQQLARGLGQDSLQFDEFIDDDDDDSSSSNTEADDGTDGASLIDGDETPDLAERAHTNHSKQRTNAWFDPDEDYESEDEDEEEEDDSGDRDVEKTGTQTRDKPDAAASDEKDIDDDVSVEWEDELIPYDLEDDEEDLRETPKPLQLLEALDLLRTGDNHDHASSRHEAALDALPDLIRARPDNLDDAAVSLVLQLLRMEDRFGIDGFGSKRKAAVLALLVEAPVLVGQALVEQLFEEGGLADRLTILECLQAAAFELSGTMSLVEGAAKKEVGLPVLNAASGSFPDPCKQEESLTKLRNDQSSRILSKTRRKRSRAQPTAVRNRFSSIAPLWFYSLIAGFVKHKEDETLWNGSTGSILLAYFLRCLSAIVEFSGVRASQVLASDLLGLAWEFRTADVAEVRLSVLVAVSTSIATLSDEKLITLLLGSSEAGLSKTMLEMSHNDPDNECRSLSKTIALSIHEVLNNRY